MKVPLEKASAGIVLYPVVQKNVIQKEIWEEERSGVTTEKGLGLYLHIPFCVSICPFCPFVKYRWSIEKEKTYVKSLKKEMTLYSRLPIVKKNSITTVYFGGGTPTALTTDSLIELLDSVQECFSVSPNAEIAMETHSLTARRDKLSRVKERGVKRVTLGVQSFSKNLQRVLGCAHTGEQAMRAIRTVQEVGFESVGVDLFYRIPTQTTDEWKWNLETAVEHGVDHISCYNLGVHPGTALYEHIKQGKIPEQPAQDFGVDLHHYARTYLNQCGYREYSISNFAKQDKACLYLRLTLEAPQGEHLGLGVSSFEYANDFYSSKVTSLENYQAQIEKDVIPYLHGTFVSKKEGMARFMVLGIGCLRVSKDAFRKRFGIEIKDVYGNILNDLIKWNLIREDASEIYLTETGMGYAAGIAKLFFTNASEGILQGVKVV